VLNAAALHDCHVWKLSGLKAEYELDKIICGGVIYTHNIRAERDKIEIA
jgi:hypothetical protein